MQVICLWVVYLYAVRKGLEYADVPCADLQVHRALHAEAEPLVPHLAAALHNRHASYTFLKTNREGHPPCNKQ